MQPTDSAVGEITELLERWNSQDSSAKGPLMALVYSELKRIAERRMRRERVNHTLQPTALISELYIVLAGKDGIHWRNRAHFLAVASEAMRRILVDHARAHNAEKRGGLAQTLQLDEANAFDIDPFFDILELDDLLEKLAEEDPRMAKVVQLRYFGGLSIEEAAQVLGVHERTVKRDWQVARAWLFSQLRRGNSDDRGGMGRD